MIALGLTVALPTPKRPVVRAVLLRDPFDADEIPPVADVTLAEEFELTSPEEDWARLASDYFQAVSGRVSTLKPDIVIVRRADMPRRPNNLDGPRLRLVVEGAISAAAYRHVANSHLRTGLACATAYGQHKDIMDAAGRALVQRTNRAEAAGAALSGLIANRT